MSNMIGRFFQILYLLIIQNWFGPILVQVKWLRFPETDNWRLVSKRVYSVLWIRAVGNCNQGGPGGAYFGRSGNPIQTGGPDCAHHITTRSPQIFTSSHGPVNTPFPNRLMTTFLSISHRCISMYTLCILYFLLALYFFHYCC